MSSTALSLIVRPILVTTTAAMVAYLTLTYGGRCPAQEKAKITVRSLLAEMTDRSELARLPSADYTVEQVSTYDRRQKTPDEPAGWFANQDYAGALREEVVNGQRQWVLMDHHGPGCLTRMWAPNTDGGFVRIYLDGAEQPALAGPLHEVLAGQTFASAPLALLAVRGYDLYLPISFQRSCKITLDREPFYYAFQYRAYAPDAAVETFSTKLLAAHSDAIAHAVNELEQPTSFAGAPAAFLKSRIEPHKSAAVELPQGGAAVTELCVRLTSANPAGIEQALRSTVLKVVFDDLKTVWCPVGEFFGRGIAGTPYTDWCRTVGPDGMLTCRWVMPYARSGCVELQNLADHAVDVDVSVSTCPWNWDEHSLHFHANWRQQFPIDGTPADFNYLNVQGAGRYVGDTLTTMNPTWSWWGEGDERIYVDGASFPQVNGTGLEDYYGYAWGVPDFFESPFLSASRVRFTPVESEHVGHTTVSRLRSLDAVPFRKSLRVDMEVSCIGKNEGMAWSSAVFWYARPGAASTPSPSPAEAARPLPYPPGLSRRHLTQPLTQDELVRIIPGRQRRPGAIECEQMMHTSTPGVATRVQEMFKWDPQSRYSNGEFLLIDARTAGDYVELKIPVADATPQRYQVYAAKGPGFSSIRFEVNGRRVKGEFDQNAESGGLTSPIDLGLHASVNGLLTLRAVVVTPAQTGSTDAAPIGLDCVVPTPPP